MTPWDCCDKTLPDHFTVCPECGEKKAAWTLRFQKTRQFQIARPTWIELELFDHDGHPVPGREYMAKLPDGTVREGELDEHGFLRIDRIKQKGEVDVSFPERSPSWIELEVVHPNGEPAAGERYVLECGEERREGTLDEDGLVRLTNVEPGMWALTLPDRV